MNSDLVSVRTESITSSVGFGDLPMDGGGRSQMVVETVPSSGRKKWIIPAAIILVATMLAAIVGLSIGLTHSSNAGSSDNVNAILGGTSVTPAPTKPPSGVSPFDLAVVTDYIKLNQYSTVGSLEDPNSPQRKAASFVAQRWQVPTENADDFATYKWMEEYVLVVFFYSMNGDAWKSDLNFLHPKRATCNWFLNVETPVGPLSQGASCNPSAGVVDTLFVVDNNLRGAIPTELGLLTALRNFVFLNAALTGSTIPETFANLKNLVNFSCIWCGFDGTIPEWINELTSLKSIFLKGNQLTGSFPAGMGTMTNLLEISVEDNLLTGDLSVLGIMTNLKNLFLEDNGFVQTIDEEFLKNLIQLELLDISDNGFKGQVPGHLMATLTTMDVHGNALTSFPDTIPAGNSTIKFLTVHENPLTGPFPVNTITNLVQLEHFDATSTEFTGDMPTEFGDMRRLEYLFLADTTFNAGLIPGDYQRLTNLVDLSLKDSRRTGKIPSWIEVLDKLILLDLDSNDLTGTIPTEIAGMANLAFLLLNRNALTGTIPEELSFATDLRVLLLDHNTNLSGSLESFCVEVNDIFRVVADCLTGSAKVVAPVNCSCCTSCCAPGDSKCNSYDWFADIDPEWSGGYDRNDLYGFRDGNITKTRRKLGIVVDEVNKAQFLRK